MKNLEIIFDILKLLCILKSFSPHSDLTKWAGILASNFQMGTVSAIKPWLACIKEIKCLSNNHLAKCISVFKQFDKDAKKVFDEAIEKKKLTTNNSRLKQNNFF